MHIRSIIVISGVVFLMTATAALSKDDVVPKIDLEKQCTKSQQVTDSLTGTKNPESFDSCIKNEQSARDKLIERWATIPASDKALCIHSTQFSPSYFEWLGCIDTRDYVRKQREKDPTSMRTSRLCPIVNWNSYGEITSVAACQLR
ncbi:MAG: hypothetical protein WBY67_04545 [Pseudolabrys sp.]|jgi:hypothetical protein